MLDVQLPGLEGVWVAQGLHQCPWHNTRKEGRRLFLFYYSIISGRFGAMGVLFSKWRPCRYPHAVV